MTAVRVTVGIPFFDEAEHLAVSIRSVLAQTMGDLELILVDDGSRDASLAIARGFGDPRVRVLTDGKRLGLPARLNQIVREARAPLVARMDGDDVIHPTRLAKQIRLLDEKASCDVVGTWVALIDESEAPFAVIETALPASPRTALVTGLIPHATMLARREWLLAHPYDESLTRAEDRDLWCRTVGTTRIEVVAEPLYVVRVRSTRVDFLADYLASQRQNRMIFLRHGPRLVGRASTWWAWLLAHAKGGVMRVASRTHAIDRIVRRRGRLPTPSERVMIAEAILSGSGEKSPA